MMKTRILSGLILSISVCCVIALSPDISPARGDQQWPNLLSAEVRFDPEHAVLHQRAQLALQDLLQSAEIEH